MITIKILVILTHKLPASKTTSKIMSNKDWPWKKDKKDQIYQSPINRHKYNKITIKIRQNKDSNQTYFSKKERIQVKILIKK